MGVSHEQAGSHQKTRTCSAAIVTTLPWSLIIRSAVHHLHLHNTAVGSSKVYCWLCRGNRLHRGCFRLRFYCRSLCCRSWLSSGRSLRLRFLRLESRFCRRSSRSRFLSGRSLLLRGGIIHRLLCRHCSISIFNHSGFYGERSLLFLSSRLSCGTLSHNRQCRHQHKCSESHLHLVILPLPLL